MSKVTGSPPSAATLPANADGAQPPTSTAQPAASPLGSDEIAPSSSSSIGDALRSVWDAVAGDDLGTLGNSQAPLWQRGLAAADLATNVVDPVKGALETGAKIAVETGVKTALKHEAEAAAEHLAAHAGASIEGDAAKIAGGHAWTKHQAEFPGWSHSKFESTVQSTMLHPDATKSLSRGRTAYWNDQEQMVVIRNPGASDAGTAFQPQNGKAYFEGLR